MAKQLLIYERAVPVNPLQHGDLAVKSGADYGFAKQVNSVPLMAAEFEPADNFENRKTSVIFAVRS